MLLMLSGATEAQSAALAVFTCTDCHRSVMYSISNNHHVHVELQHAVNSLKIFPLSSTYALKTVYFLCVRVPTTLIGSMILLSCFHGLSLGTRPYILPVLPHVFSTAFIILTRGLVRGDCVLLEHTRDNTI